MKKLMAILFVLTLALSVSNATVHPYCPCCPPDNGGGQGDLEGDCYSMGETEATSEECTIAIGVNLPDITVECTSDDICISGNPGETIELDPGDAVLEFLITGALGYDVLYDWNIDDSELGDIDVAYTADAGPATLPNTDPDNDGLGEMTAEFEVNEVTIPAGTDYGDYYLHVSLTVEYDI